MNTVKRTLQSIKEIFIKNPNRQEAKKLLKNSKLPTVTKTKNVCKWSKSCDLYCDNCCHSQLYPNQL